MIIIDKKNYWFCSVLTFFFSNKAWFHLDSYINMQSDCVWNSENPQIFWTTSLHPQKVGIWCTMGRKRVLGPFFRRQLLWSTTILLSCTPHKASYTQVRQMRDNVDRTVNIHCAIAATVRKQHAVNPSWSVFLRTQRVF